MFYIYHSLEIKLHIIKEHIYMSCAMKNNLIKNNILHSQLLSDCTYNIIPSQIKNFKLYVLIDIITKNKKLNYVL